MANAEIKIGDTVRINSNVRIASFDYKAIRLEIIEHNKIITVPRFISSLGQFFPGYNWKPIPRKGTMEEDFWLTGRYRIEDRLYISGQYSASDLDSILYTMQGEVVDGAIIWGKVAGIFAVYTDTDIVEMISTDVEFFDSVAEAMYAQYAYSVFIILQDQGSFVEYPVELKYLSTM